MSCPKKYIQESVTDPIERDRLNNLHDSIGQEALTTNNFRKINETIAVISKKYAEATRFLKEAKEKYGQGVVKFAREGSKSLLEVNVLNSIGKQAELPLVDIQSQIDKLEDHISNFENLIKNGLEIEDNILEEKLKNCA